MNTKALYVQFCKEYWDFFLPSDLTRDRKGITFEQWLRRTPAARKAMLRYLETNGAPQKNPFFWVQDFPEPRPHNLNGESLPDEPLVRAKYNGVGGLYTKAEATLFNMQIIGEFKQ